MSERVGAVVLAAGAATRFGGEKLLAPLHGTPLLRHVTDTVARAIAAGVLEDALVVVRPGDVSISRVVEAGGLRVVVAPQAELGLARSLAAGLDALASTPLTAALVLLGDQPLVTPEAMAAICREGTSTDAALIRPRYAQDPDAPGHPVLLKRAVWDAVREIEGDSVLTALERLGTAVHLVRLPGRNPDVDTPAQLEAMAGARTGAAAPRPDHPAP